MNIAELAEKYGITEPEMRDACATLGIAVTGDGDVDETALRNAIAARRTRRAASVDEPATTQPATTQPATTQLATTEPATTEPAGTRFAEPDAVATTSVRVTPALLAGAALAGAFFMPLVSGFGGILTISSWGYMRLGFDFRDEFKAGDWIVLAFLALVGIAAIGVVFTEATGRRIRPLLIATAVDVVGLVVYVAIKVGSFDGFRHADIAGYIAMGSALVLLATGLGVLDNERREFRRTLYGVCAVLLVAGIAIPAGTSSFRSDLNDVFDGIQSNLDDAVSSADGAGTTEDATIASFEVESAVQDQLSADYDIDALVNCDDDLDRKVGASEVCTFETFDSDDEFDVAVEVSEISPDVSYTIEPSTQPN